MSPHRLGLLAHAHPARDAERADRRSPASTSRSTPMRVALYGPDLRRPMTPDRPAARSGRLPAKP
jgi:hypothetical protein